jgi:hypothetical protein
MARNIPILDRIRALIARAEHPETPAPEAEVALREANKLMTRHAVEAAELYASQSTSERRRPVKETWHWLEDYSEFSAFLRTMLGDIARHNRCRAVVSYARPWKVTVVGMREDVDWVQTLYTNCYLTFIGAVNPRWDKEASFDSNVYRHKVAGFTWIETWWRMVDALGIRDEIPVGYTWPRVPCTDWAAMARYKELGIPRPPIEGKTSTFVAAYRRYAKEIGDTSVLTTHLTEVYRRSFAKGFSDQISYRLYLMKCDSDAETAGHELVLADVATAVNEAFYEEFPEYHPDMIRTKELIREQESLESQRREQERRDAMLNAMTPKKRAEFLEKEERARRRDRESNERYWQREDAKIKYVDAGGRAGRKAADSVRLTRSTDIDDTSATRRIGAGA